LVQTYVEKLEVQEETFLIARGNPVVAAPWLLLLGIIPIHFLCFYWWSAESYYFSGDALFYFSRQIHSFPELVSRFLSIDELYQYRPLTYVFFTFVLHPLFGSNPYWYHVTAYLFSSVNVLLASTCIYHWVGRSSRLVLFASIFLALNPVQFFPSFGPTYIDQWLSSFFYYLALLMVLRESDRLRLLAVPMFMLALLSKEHSVLLPVHAVLVFVALGQPFGEALRKTRYLWLVFGAFAVFQLAIRHGMVFAPEGANPNLQFDLSIDRIVELLKGAKPAFFYPENYLLDETIGIGRALRLSVLIPLSAFVLVGIWRRPRLAVSGMVWLTISLLPVAFLQQPPSARHYHLGLPGLAILFACAIPSWRVIFVATPVLALLTVTNVHLYAQESWVAVGARLTKKYVVRIDELLRDTGRSSFYVLNGGDPHFAWHVDGGAAVPWVLGRDATFRFAAQMHPLETEVWLNNGVNVVVASDGEITDAVETGQFPPESDPDVCALISQLATTRSCAVLYRGQPFERGASQAIDTPGQSPVFEVPEGIVTISRTTIRVEAESGLDLDHVIQLVAESADGVIVEVFGQRDAVFTKVASEPLIAGERRDFTYSLEPGVFEYVFIRIHPNSDERNDWLVWEPGTAAGTP
jgi:hypothetical protein